MKKIAVYIAGEMIPWLFLGVVGISLLFLVSQAIRVAPVFAGAGLVEAGRALGLALVPVVGWALTPAFAIAVFAALGRMEQDGELTALDATGLRRSALAAGPAALAIALALVSAAIWLEAGPAAERRLREAAIDMAGEAVARSLRPGRFVEPLPKITFYAEESRGPSTYRKILLEDARDPERIAEFSARSAGLEVSRDDHLLLLRLESGSAFFFSARDRRPPAVLSFRSLDLALPIGAALESRVGFLPDLLARATSELMGPPPPGTAAEDWSYAFWRRIAGPIGLLALGLLSIALALSAGLRGRAVAASIAAVLFLVYHLLCRGCESLLASRVLGPIPAALAPAAAIGLVLLAVLIRPLPKIRLSGRR